MGAAGAASSLLMGFSPAWGAGWTLAIGFMGSFFILGDSGVLSAAIADSVPARHLGKVMGIRSLAGFGIGSFAPLSFWHGDGCHPPVGFGLCHALCGRRDSLRGRSRAALAHPQYGITLLLQC